MIYTLEELKKKIAPIAVKYEIPAVYVFGSYARNEATENSDLDFLVDLKGSKVSGLFEMGGLYDELCDMFGAEVDMVAEEALTQDDRTPWFAENILKERVAIYGEQRFTAN